MEAAATPFPREETTPPVTKMYFGAVRKSGSNSSGKNLRTQHYAAEMRARVKLRISFGGNNFLEWRQGTEN